MRLAPRNWANALFLWLSLATVLVPAIGSSGSPLRLTEGSAFSAFTSDVSLGPSRAAPIEAPGEGLTSGGDGDGASASIASSGEALAGPDAAQSLPVLRPDFIEPPPRHPATFAAGPIGARAPPVL
jgi:hypothetical protein